MSKTNKYRIKFNLWKSPNNHRSKMLFDMEQLTKLHWSLIIVRTVLFVIQLFVSWMLNMTIFFCSSALLLPLLPLLFRLLLFTFIHIYTCLIHSTRTSHLSHTDWVCIEVFENRHGTHSGKSGWLTAKTSFKCIQISY